MAPIALVTGTSTGIGLSTAIHLARAGFEVVATLRNLDKAEPLRARAAAENLRLDIRELDVASDTSVRQCLEGVLQRHGHLDVLVNNAGTGLMGSIEQTPPDMLRHLMEVNFFGVWRMTQAVLPHMRERRSGRILTVTSLGGLIGQPFNDAYCASKFAVEGFMESFAPVAWALGIQLSLIEPGPVHTEFINTMLSSSPALRSDLGVYGPLLAAYRSTARALLSEVQTADDVARVIVEAATAAQPHLRYATSNTVRQLASRKYVDPRGDAVLSIFPLKQG